MSKSLSSFPEHLRMEIATRRVNNPMGGLGTLGARDYYHRMGKKTPQQLMASVVNKPRKRKRKESEDENISVPNDQ